MSSKQSYPFFNLTGYRGIIVKKFTAHYACRNTDLNLRLVAATTNRFLLQIIDLLIQSWGVRLTCLDCKTWRKD